jgi:hypothetical protein
VGHNAGLTHADEVNQNLSALTKDLEVKFVDSADFNTDNYWVAGPQFLAQYAEKLRDAKERPKDK